jgi:hypothetical protein
LEVLEQLEASEQQALLAWAEFEQSAPRLAVEEFVAWAEQAVKLTGQLEQAKL